MYHKCCWRFFFCFCFFLPLCSFVSERQALLWKRQQPGSHWKRGVVEWNTKTSLVYSRCSQSKLRYKSRIIHLSVIYKTVTTTISILWQCFARNINLTAFYCSWRWVTQYLAESSTYNEFISYERRLYGRHTKPSSSFQLL